MTLVEETKAACPGCEVCELAEELLEARAQLGTLLKALEEISERQPDVLRMIRSNGFQFTSHVVKPGNWENLAFSIYNNLCEVDLIARDALASARESAP